MTKAPKPGEAATVGGDSGEEFTFRADRSTDAERALRRCRLACPGDARSAEHLLEERARAKGSSALTALLYARAIDRRLTCPRTAHRARARRLETTLKTWPTAWEAVLGHAQLTARRRGAAEGRLEALREIAQAKAEHTSLDPMVHRIRGGSAPPRESFST